jgi:hypothetical protein
MKKKLLLVPLFFQVISSTCCLAQGHSKDTLYVESVAFNILTFSSITCGEFATNFKDRIKFRAITNKDTIRILDSFLSKVRYPKKDRDLNVRAKFIFEKGDKSTITICTNGYEILVDERLIRHNSRFADFLRALTI